MSPFFKFFLVLMVLFSLSSCITVPSHNLLGGYTDACGELPGQLGDDC